MARFNEILTGRFNRAVQKLLSMKGRASLVTLSDEMFPVIEVEPLFAVENRYLTGWNVFSIATQIAAAATFSSQAQIRNPAGSNVLVVIEKFEVSNSTAAVQQIGASSGAKTTDLTSIISLTGTNMDSRGPTGPNSIYSGSNGSAASPLLCGHANVFLPVGATYDTITTLNQEIVINPGSAFYFDSATVNAQLNFVVRFRERFLEDSERT